MLNPLVDSLADYNLTQLEDKIIELQRKYFQTRNPGLQAQIANILEIYKEELYTRRAIEAQRQRDQDGNNSLDSLINIS
jgi:hypothetical protein